MSRQTFYQIFDSKEEVMQYHFFSFFYKHREFIEILISDNLIYLLEQQFSVYVQKIDLFRILNIAEAHSDYTASYVSGALTQILIHWFDQSFDLDIKEVSRLTETIITGQHLHNR